jgi:hypothetical protein
MGASYAVQLRAPTRRSHANGEHAAMKRRTDDSTGKPRGQTVPQQGERQERSPRQPHERDESADSQSRAEASQQRMGEIAHESIERGQTDTDRGPVIDETYEREFRKPGEPSSNR